jgi:hypothetical protein
MCVASVLKTAGEYILFIYFIYGLFNDAVNISDYMACNGRTNNEFDRIRKDAVMA